ncbi:MAG: helix-turn-helix domain-containing protein [Bacteroidales bacterium]|nr:helix-turn-helix domain-containing protein [Bacteroidales bacterium]
MLDRIRQDETFVTSLNGSPSIMEDRWLSVDEIGEYLGIKRDTVYKWIAEKTMPAHRVGRFWKFKKDEVDEWVKEGYAGDPPVKDSV